MAGRNFIGGEDRIRCSFCGKTQEQVRKLIAGPNGAYICDVCVDICAEIIEEEATNMNAGIISTSVGNHLLLKDPEFVNLGKK